MVTRRGTLVAGGARVAYVAGVPMTQREVRKQSVRWSGA